MGTVKKVHFISVGSPCSLCLCGEQSLIKDSPQRPTGHRGYTEKGGDELYQLKDVPGIGMRSVLKPTPNKSFQVSSDSHEKLIAVLKLAYSGELAAAYAYRGHWKSVVDLSERESVAKIENEEWHHRQLVGEMLAMLANMKLPPATRAIQVTTNSSIVC
jgi:hypothetical protein